MNSTFAKMSAATTLGLALLAGCSTDPEDAAAPDVPASAPASPSPDTSPTASASSPSASASSPSATATQSPSSPALTRVDPNTASVEELTAALEAAGVPNAERWAREVEEHRPYNGAADLVRLRQELNKSNIDEATFAKIVSVLQP